MNPDPSKAIADRVVVWLLVMLACSTILTLCESSDLGREPILAIAFFVGWFGRMAININRERS